MFREFFKIMKKCGKCSGKSAELSRVYRNILLVVVWKLRDVKHEKIVGFGGNLLRKERTLVEYPVSRANYMKLGMFSQPGYLSHAH